MGHALDIDAVYFERGQNDARGRGKPYPGLDVPDWHYKTRYRVDAGPVSERVWDWDWDRSQVTEYVWRGRFLRY